MNHGKTQIGLWLMLIAFAFAIGMTGTGTARAQATSQQSSTDFTRTNKRLSDGEQQQQRVPVTQDFVDKCGQAADEVAASREAIAALKTQIELEREINALTRTLADERKEQANANSAEARNLRAAIDFKNQEIAALKIELERARKKRGGSFSSVLKIAAGILIGRIF